MADANQHLNIIYHKIYDTVEEHTLKRLKLNQYKISNYSVSTIVMKSIKSVILIQEYCQINRKLPT